MQKSPHERTTQLYSLFCFGGCQLKGKSQFALQPSVDMQMMDIKTWQPLLAMKQSKTSYKCHARVTATGFSWIKGQMTY